MSAPCAATQAIASCATVTPRSVATARSASTNELVAAARRAVAAGEVASVSAYFAAAVEHRRRTETLSQFVDDLIGAHGRPSAQAYAWADEALGE